MPKTQYGTKTIDYDVQEKAHLKSHYITVEKGKGVILKGKALNPAQAEKLILKKAKWIIDKLELVRAIEESDIVTGSRMQYLGRKYYVELFANEAQEKVEIEFTASKFKVRLSPTKHKQSDIQAAFDSFFRQKAKEKIAPRLDRLSKTTGFQFKELKFIKLEKRWGSCTAENNIIINTQAIKLPFTLIDYLLVHELVHTKVKNHSKAFWNELGKHLVNWQELDEKMYGMRL